jgi:hypothetical protein
MEKATGAVAFFVIPKFEPPKKFDFSTRIATYPQYINTAMRALGFRLNLRDSTK